MKFTSIIVPTLSVFLAAPFLHAQVTATGDYTPTPFASPTWNVGGELRIGDSTGIGTLNILTGGTVTNTKAFIGVEPASTGSSVDVDGGIWTNSLDLTVGYSASSNSLDIQNGGSVSSAGAFLGYNSASNYNAVTVAGTSSSWIVSDTFHLGYSGSQNEVTVSSGGLLQATALNKDFVIGSLDGSNGNTLTVTGAGSAFTNDATLYVGDKGDNNTLELEQGSQTTSKNVRIGGNALSSGNTVTVSDSGTIWTITGTQIRVGSGGSNNTLEIKNGAQVNVSTGLVVIGRDSTSSNNTLSLSGIATALNIGGNLLVGRSGTNNELNLSDAASLSAAQIIFGEMADSSGSADFGTGTITTSQISEGVGSGTVTFNNTTLIISAAQSTLFSGFEDGDVSLLGELLLDSNGFAVGSAYTLSGVGGLTKNGTGTLTLTGSNTYTGTTTINEGTLALSTAGRLASSSSLVIGGGELTFVNSESVSSFTQTAGTINFDVTHSGSPLVNCQLVPGTDNDVLYVSGVTQLGGTIHVTQGGTNEFARGESAILIDGTPGDIDGLPDNFTDDFARRNFLVIDNANGLVTLLGSGVADGASLADTVGLTGNQMVIADVINTNISGNGNILDASDPDDQMALLIIGDCDGSPAAGLSLISPEVYAGFTDYGVETIRSYSKAALSMPGFSNDGSARSLRIPVGTSSEPVVTGVSSKSITSVFAGYTHYSTGTDSSINGADYDIKNYGGIVGVRHDVNGLMLGGFLGVDEGDVNSSTLNSDSDAFLLGAIASYTIKPEINLIATSGITYGCYDFSGTRFTGIGNASFDEVGSDVFDIHVGLEGDAYAADNIRVTPFIGFHYIYSDTEAFSETGPGALTLDAHDYDAFFSEIGVKAEYQFTKQFSLNGNLSYTQNVSGSEKNIGASLGGTPFAVASPGLGNDFFTIGMGAQYQVTENVRLGINYRAEFSTDAEVANGVNIGGSYSF